MLYHKGMSYALATIKDRPSHLWMLNGALTDHTGNGGTVTSTGTLSYAVPLVYDAGQSTIVGNGTTLKFPFPHATAGTKNRQFAVEAWFYPITNTQTTILSHSGDTDMLVWTGDKVRFTLKFADSPALDAVIEHKPDTIKNMHVVVNYSRTAIAMYVNGLLVKAMQLGDDQQLSEFKSFTTDAGYVYAGQGAGRVSLQAVAWYETPLSDPSTFNHFASGKTTVPAEQVGGAYRPSTVDSNKDDLPIFLIQELDTDEEWLLGRNDGVTIDSDMLMPAVNDEGISVAGEWVGAFPLFFCDPPVASKVTIEWMGEGATVSTSLDGITWVQATNNSKIAYINDPFVTTEKDLWLKVAFAGGVQDDESYLESLTVTGFKSNQSPADIMNKLTVSNAVTVRQPAEPIEYRDDAGILLDGGSMTIARTTNSVGPSALEYWIKPKSGTPSVNQYMKNYTRNPSIETDASLWQPTNVTLSQVSDWSASGTKSMRISVNASGTPALAYPLQGTNVFITTANGDYTSARARVRAMRNCRATLTAFTYDAAGAAVAGHPTVTHSVDLTTGQEATLQTLNHRLSPDFPTATQVLFILFVYQTGTLTAPNWTGDTLRVDEFATYVHGNAPTGLTTLPYIDGTKAGAAWDGTPHLSTSSGMVSIGGTRFVNGVSSSAALAAGQWHHIVQPVSPDAGDITLSGDAIVLSPKLYSKVFTATEALNNFRSYTGIPGPVITDTSLTSIVPGSTPVEIYAHDWSIESI